MFEVVMSGFEDETREPQDDLNRGGVQDYTLESLRFAIEAATVSVFRVADNRRILDANEFACRTHGYAREELLGMDVLDIDTTLTPGLWLEHREIVRTSGLRTFESVHRRKDGSRFPVEVTVRSFELRGRRETIAFAHDITERKRADLALEEAEEWFRAMFENIVIGVYQITPDGTVLNANPALAKMLGFESIHDLRKCNLRDTGLGPDFTRTEFSRAIGRNGQVVGLEDRWRRTDGTVVWVRENARAICAQPGSVMYYEGTAEDITYRIEMEEALRRSEVQYKSFFEEDVTAALMATPDGRIDACNLAFVRAFKYSSRAEATSTNVSALYPDAQSYAELVTLVREKRALDDCQLELRKRDGSPAFVRAKFVGIFDEFEDLVQIKQYIIDETERKSLEQQLVQAQKLEGIGRLAGGVAHDYNNILGVILGHGELLLRKLPNDDPIRHQVEAIVGAGNRAAELTRRLLAFARKEIVSPKILNLNLSIESIQKMIQRLIGENIKLNFSPGADLWDVRIDPTQFDQILINLATNARDAIEDVGTIIVETLNVTISDEYIHHHADFTQGEYVQLVFSDSGIGMDEETKSKIFEPFFTTKPKGQGTGLGLSTVYGIIKQNGGNLNVYSEPGKGTTFRIYLPRFNGERKDAAPAKELHSLFGTETILVVEDQQDLLEMARDSLEAFGYRVITALTPGEAILLFGSCRHEVDLLLTDVIMPSMNGKELRSRIERIRPGLRTIFMSGYTANVITDRGILDEGIEFIQKPFTPQEIAKKVRDILTSTKG